MSRVITFSRTFPSYHPKAGINTGFVEKIWNSLGIRPVGIDSYQYLEDLNPNLNYSSLDYFIKDLTIGDDLEKHHTIRAGHRWKVGDWFKPVVWGNDINLKSRRRGPYHSKQIIIAPDIQVKKVWDFYKDEYKWLIPEDASLNEIAQNDGLSIVDFMDWFYISKGKSFDGQIICWNENIKY